MGFFLCEMNELIYKLSCHEFGILLLYYYYPRITLFKQKYKPLTRHQTAMKPLKNVFPHNGTGLS